MEKNPKGNPRGVEITSRALQLLKNHKKTVYSNLLAKSRDEI